MLAAIQQKRCDYLQLVDNQEDLVCRVSAFRRRTAENWGLAPLNEAQMQIQRVIYPKRAAQSWRAAAG
jgi:hypothetical protein